ncbi:MAG: GH12 family glycosyl hydrolase domain-containing protein [Acidilobus sp.]
MLSMFLIVDLFLDLTRPQQPVGVFDIQLVSQPNATPLIAVPCVIASQPPGGPYAMYNVTFPSHVSVVIEPDVWNAKSGQGDVVVKYCREGVFAYVNNTGTTALNVYDTVLGYPEVIYGYKPWGQTMTGESPALALPLKASLLPNITVYLNYTLDFTDGRGDFSFDLWLTRAYKPSSVGQGDLEVMIWLYHSPGFVPMGYPRPNATFVAPMVVNGTAVNVTWTAYVARSIPWTYIALALTPPLMSGAVQFSLTQLLAEASSLWQEVSNYSFGQLYLNDAELGMEYTSLTWPPIDVNVSAWYAIYSYGFLLSALPQQTTKTLTTIITPTASTTTPATASTKTSTVTKTVSSTTTITASVTLTSTEVLYSPKGFYMDIALAVIVVTVAAVAATLLLRGRQIG